MSALEEAADTLEALRLQGERRAKVREDAELYQHEDHEPLQIFEKREGER